MYFSPVFSLVKRYFFPLLCRRGKGGLIGFRSRSSQKSDKIAAKNLRPFSRPFPCKSIFDFFSPCNPGSRNQQLEKVPSSPYSPESNHQTFLPQKCVSPCHYASKEPRGRLKKSSINAISSCSGDTQKNPISVQSTSQPTCIPVQPCVTTAPLQFLPRKTAIVRIALLLHLFTRACRAATSYFPPSPNLALRPQCIFSFFFLRQK